MGIRMPAPPPPIPPRAKRTVKSTITRAEYDAGMRTQNGRPPGWLVTSANKAGAVAINDDGTMRHANGSTMRLPGTPNNAAGIVNWNSRHQLILWMDLAGRSVKDIALDVGYHPTTVSAIRTSELYQTQKSQLVERLTGSTLGDAMEMIRRDVPRNLQVLINLRDSEIDHGGDPKVRIAAAKQMSREADRVYPRITKHEEDRTIKITLDAGHLNRLAGALRDVGVLIDADVVEALDPANAPPNPNLIEGKSIDQLVDELNRAAAQSGDDN